MLTRYAREEISRIVKEDLYQRFEGQFVFGPIISEEKTDMWGDPYLDILIVFEGDLRDLDPYYTGGMSLRIGSQIESLGTEYPSSHGFMTRAEYEEWQERERAFDTKRPAETG